MYFSSKLNPKEALSHAKIQYVLQRLGYQFIIENALKFRYDIQPHATTFSCLQTLFHYIHFSRIAKVCLFLYLSACKTPQPLRIMLICLVTIVPQLLLSQITITLTIHYSFGLFSQFSSLMTCFYQI